MCGLTCLFSRSGAFAGVDPEALLPILAHRGPDSSGVVRDERALLIHNRLAILDLSEAAAQPFVSPATGNVLLFNGEIYNFRELREKHPEVRWRTRSDTEVVLELFDRLGPECVHELNGIFAFVVYEPREGLVHAFRDRLGVKPLCWHGDGDRLLIASEAKALAPHLPRARLDRDAFGDFLSDGLLCHDERTFVAGVRSLPAASWLRWDLAAGRGEIQPWWRLRPDVEEVPVEEALEEVGALLADSVRLNLVSDVEVAVSLSSGLDSTLLHALLGEQGQARMRAFTFGYDAADYDEIRRVRGNPALADAPLEATVLQPDEALGLLAEAIGTYETPLGGLGSLSAYHMMRTVSERDIKVILAGEGADEVFGGYRYYYPAYLASLRNDATQLNRELEGYNRLHGTDLRFPSAEFDRFVAPVATRGPRAPDGTRLDQHAYATPALLEGTAPGSEPEGTESLRDLMVADLTVRKLPKLLHFQDRAAAAHGVECRVPYLDHRLVERLHALPGTLKIRDGRNKFLAREILQRRFGIQLHQDVKHYVATPQREWLKGPLYEPTVDLLREGALRESGWVDLDAFFRDFEAYRSSPDLGNSFFAWKLLNLELLARRWPAS